MVKWQLGMRLLLLVLVDSDIGNLVPGKWDGTLDSIKGEALLTKTGAKMYYRGGGWWGVVGYHHANWDVMELKEILIKNSDYRAQWIRFLPV